jgi:hypothetical protein
VDRASAMAKEMTADLLPDDNGAGAALVEAGPGMWPATEA